jgi:hypothetical protein
MKPLRTLVLGLGQMGRSHALAYNANPGFEIIGLSGHQALCEREQAFVFKAILDDLDLTRHMSDAVRSLEVVLAADRSMRERRAIDI